MRSILSRSLVAVATLAIGSAALAAAPAHAATPSGVTRDQVLAAAAGLRTDAPTAPQIAALTDIIKRTCDVLPSEEVLTSGQQAVTAGDDVDGFAMSTVIYPSGRNCSFAAFASVDPAFSLGGTATVTSQPTTSPLPATTTLYSGPLSGDAFVTAPYVATGLNTITASAAGNVTRSTTTTTTTRITDKKSKAEKKAAAKRYAKRLAAAKKAYAKALKKADGDASKKAAAKRAYAAKRSAAKAKYQREIAGFRLVTSTRTTTENRPYSVTGSYTLTP